MTPKYKVAYGVNRQYKNNESFVDQIEFANAQKKTQH